MPLSRSQFAKDLEPGLNTHFGLEYDRYSEQWRELFAIERSQKAFEEDSQQIGFGPAPTKAEGAAIAYDSASEGYMARYNHLTYALAFSITEEAMEDNLYGSLGKKYVRALVRSMVHTKEVTGANILNRAFNSSFLGGDGVELCSLAHPTSHAGNQQNELTTAADLNETSIENMLTLISQMKDDRGINIAAKGHKLVVPPDLEFVATRILESLNRSGTADNDINAMRKLGKLPEGMCVNNRLTDTDAWFILTDIPDGLKMFQRIALQRGMEGDFETGNMRYKTRERYSFGWTDWRGIFGSPGA